MTAADAMEQYQTQLNREITEVIAKNLLAEVSSPEDDLLGSGILDSLTLVQLLLELEHRFRITIPLEQLEIDDFRSVASLARLVQSRTAPDQNFSAEGGGNGNDRPSA